jgi:hypothetical protein
VTRRLPSRPDARPRRRSWRGLIAAAALLLASPCAAQTWSEFLASLGPHQPPAEVLAYLAHNPLVASAPAPRFTEIRTETVDGSLAQHYRLLGFENGMGRLEGVREERSTGNRRSGAHTVAMVTALAGLVLVSLDDQTTGTSVFLRKIELDGALLPPAVARPLTIRYERVQVANDTVVEEVRDCALTWTAPTAKEPLLSSRCSGSTRIVKPTADNQLAVSTLPEDSTTTFVFRPDLGWAFNQNTRVLDARP